MVTENGEAMLLQLGKLSSPLRTTCLLQAVGMLLGGADGLLAMLPAQGCSHAAQVIRPPPRRRLLLHFSSMSPAEPPTLPPRSWLRPHLSFTGDQSMLRVVSSIQSTCKVTG